ASNLQYWGLFVGRLGGRSRSNDVSQQHAVSLWHDHRNHSYFWWVGLWNDSAESRDRGALHDASNSDLHSDRWHRQWSNSHYYERRGRLQQHAHSDHLDPAFSND